MNFELQPNLENELVRLRPLKVEDFEQLYEVASDPLLWEQHPNKDRYKRDVFELFFKGAIESKGAFLVFNSRTGQIIGSSRYYEFSPEEKSIAIGYTFLARQYWGKHYNKALKSVMLDHAFEFADTVFFHIGKVNIRSQKSIEKLDAKKIGEEEMAYYGEQKSTNFIYQMDSKTWTKVRSIK